MSGPILPRDPQLRREMQKPHQPGGLDNLLYVLRVFLTSALGLVAFIGGSIAVVALAFLAATGTVEGWALIPLGMVGGAIGALVLMLFFLDLEAGFWGAVVALGPWVLVTVLVVALAVPEADAVRWIAIGFAITIAAIVLVILARAALRRFGPGRGS